MIRRLVPSAWPIVALIAPLLMTGCAIGGAAATAPSTSTTSNATTSGTPVAQGASAEPAPPSELGTIKETGFGQSGEHVWATAIVHNTSSFVGQTVTVNFNVLDAGGEILASETQVESFSRPQSDHVVGTQVDLDPGVTAAKVEASLSVEAIGAFSDQPFPAVETSDYKIGPDELGGTKVSFQITNPLSQPLKDPRIGIVCRDAAGSIIGGTSQFPDLVPASGRIRVSSSPIVTSTPDRCEAVVSAPADWEGTDATASVPAQASDGTAAAAFKVWVDQFSASDWDAQYDTLTSVQQQLLSKSRYRACRNVSAPNITWVKVLAVQDVGPILVPGTSEKLPATKVTAQVSVSGVKAPIEAHMLNEEGQWRWSMTQENLDGCT